MKIKKIGHCCLLIETKGKRILTDPGSYTVAEHSKLTYIDFILITHEHQDHFHVESLKTVLKLNPQAVIYSNNSVSDLLSKEGIKHNTIFNGDLVVLDGVNLTGIGEKHAVIHSSIPISNNIGFFIDDRLWYPGDNFTNPEREVPILALPTAGPWMKISEAIDYAVLLKPTTSFPVHDGSTNGMMDTFISQILKNLGVEFNSLKSGETAEF